VYVCVMCLYVCLYVRDVCRLYVRVFVYASMCVYACG